MATTYKVLSQTAPAASTLTTAYTVPSSTATVVSSIVITNYGLSPSGYRISIAKAGASDAQVQYIAYDVTISETDAVALTLGITLATTDVVRVFSTTGAVNFTLFGSEIS
jgi:hypothetical protein